MQTQLHHALLLRRHRGGEGVQSSLCSSIFCILFVRHWGGNKLSEASTRADPCTDSSVIKLSGYLPAQVSAVRGTFCSSKLSGFAFVFARVTQCYKELFPRHCIRSPSLCGIELPHSFWTHSNFIISSREGAAATLVARVISVIGADLGTCRYIVGATGARAI